VANPNLALLIGMAQAMGPLCDRVVFEAAVQTELEPGLKLRHLSAPYFLATKFEAFNDRGNNDVYASHDLVDILTVIEGRAELGEELASAPAELRHHVAACVATLLNNSDFNNALGGLLSQPNREPLVRARLQHIAQLLDQ
jgi:hypothetical protein